ncbi:MAG: DegQ family serine endoprotease [Rhizobiales bacterium]|nr:DegQ family serine endoprotease [Hyphomicrobiales bacterium]
MTKSRFIAAPVAGRLMAVAAVIALWGAVFLSPPAQAQQPSFADLAEGLIDAVVNISTSQTVSGQRSVPMPDLPEGSPFQEFFKEFFDRNQSQPRARRVSSLGSGFVIDPSGVIVTNAHVIEDADEIEVKFNDGTVLKATVRGRDSKTDLAVLEVTPEPGTTLTSAPLGSSEALRVGDWVMAIGNPFGLGGTVTVGIVSARNRDINAGPYDDFIQTDAAINRGNSGGPLFDINGNVIGINTAIISPSGGSIGIGFAVPTETARPVIAQLREFGETRRGWLGVRIQPVTEEIAESLDMAEATGALVSGVNPHGPAAGAGIVSGDVVVEFDGKTIAEVSKLPRVVADTEIGKEVVVSVWRKGERIDLNVTVARLDEEEKTQEEEPESSEQDTPELGEVLGLTLSTITDELRSKFELEENAEGIVVVAVDQSSAAYEKGLREGDVIVEAQQEAIDTPAQFRALVGKLQEDGDRSVLFLIQRGKGDPPTYLGLPLKS